LNSSAVITYVDLDFVELLGSYLDGMDVGVRPWIVVVYREMLYEVLNICGYITSVVHFSYLKYA
jgi:hypothetical protein